jgi:arylsulfatase A-like enzyme
MDAETTPLNFLFIITDQHRPDHTGFGGNATVQTPHLDRLAETSMRFDQAFVANPICMPNRSTLITGRVPSAHGTRHNGIALDWNANTALRVLREGGYDTGLIGKSHLQNLGVNRFQIQRDGDKVGEAAPVPYGPGWDEIENFDRYKENDPASPDDFYGFSHVDFVIDHGDMASGHYYMWLLENGLAPEKLQGPDNALASYDGWDQIYQTALPEAFYPSSYVTMRTVEYLEQAATSDQPFFVQCSYPDPHHPFTPPGAYYNLYSPDAIELPETFEDQHEQSMQHMRTMLKYRGKQAGPLAPWAPTAEQFREAAAKEYGMISMVDDGVGQILSKLDELGMRENTVVIFTSDHGDMFGDHGILLKAGMHYDGCVRVPLLIDVPGKAAGASASQVGSVDFAQTVLDLAGLPEYAGMQGHSVVPILDDGEVAVRDAGMLIEEDEPFDIAGVGQELRMRSVLTSEGRLTLYQGAEHGELFDLERDPAEMDNLFAKPEGRELRFHLTERLARLQAEHDDSGRIAVHGG